jgi:hypothetical protein
MTSLDTVIDKLHTLMQFPQPNLPSHLRCVEAADLSDVLFELRLVAARRDASVPYDLDAEPMTHRGVDFGETLSRQAQFSARTFGPGARTKGVIDHLRKEVAEVEKNPSDLLEWIDVAILAFDGAWRQLAYGEFVKAEPPETEQDFNKLAAVICGLYLMKLRRNRQRTWPDWRTQSPDKAIEHYRTKDESSNRDVAHGGGALGG